MPLSLSDLFGKAEGHGQEARRASGRAAELEAELAREREAQRVAEREAAKAAKEADAERHRVEKELEGRVAALEKALPAARAAAARAAAEADTPAPDLRQMARAYLRGRLQQAPGELRRPEWPLSARDGCANAWLSAEFDAATVAELVSERLGLGPLYERVDAVEVECWAGFIRRVRQVAGETD